MAYVDNKTKEQLRLIFQSLEKETVPEKGQGWVNLVKFGPAIKSAGIDYHVLGFDKLGEFVASSGIFEKCYDVSKKKPIQYIRERTILKNAVISPQRIQKQHSKEEVTQKYNGRTIELLKEWNLEEPIAVGFFQFLSDGSYQISDFRAESFRELKYPILEMATDTIDRNVIIDGDGGISNTYKSDKYYKFEWTTKVSDDERGYKVVLSRPIRLKNIRPQELIKTLHDIWNNPDAAEQMKDVMNMVSTELMASSDGTFIYELLQNANDNAVEDSQGNYDPVDVEFHITDNYLICRHTGEYFSPRDIAGVCKLAAGTKKLRKNAIGYKGIGFKTVFHSHGWVYIQSNEFSFHFSESVNRPWQIMPVWESPTSLNSEIKSVLEKDKEKFRVVTVMKPRDKSLLRDIESKNYKCLLSDIFKDVRDIIFIPRINSVKVYDKDDCIVICQYDSSSSWVRSSLKPYNLADIQEEINKEIILHPERGIPGKYTNFGDTTVAFACKIEGEKLIPVENATVNCYLPTKAEFGFPFLMNTDMVPTGDRSQLKLDVEFNSQFAYIAGIKFVEWMICLLEAGYEASSVFDLIPDFTECKNGVGKYYSLFIDKFEAGFYEKCKSEAFIPTISNEGNYKLSEISNLLIDKTGISVSGIMSDDEFFHVSGETSLLPISSLRTNKKLKKLLETIGTKYQFDQQKLVALCEKDVFQSWLKDQNNNNKWLDYIIVTKQAKLFCNKKIFISGRSHNLEESKNLIFNSLQLRKDLACFISKHLDYLSDESYEYLSKDESKRCRLLIESGFKWKVFYPYNFVKEILDNKEEKELLKDLNNSIGFYHMIALTYEKCFPAPYSDICTKIPLVVDGKVIDSINGNCVYFYNKEGLNYKSKSWIDDSWFYFLSEKYIEYDKELMEPFFKHFVRDFTETDLISNIVLQDNHKEAINKKISLNYRDNLDFIKFLYKNKATECIADGILQCFALQVTGTNSENTFVIPQESPVYFNNASYNSFVIRPWICSGWLYGLDDSYINDLGASSEDERKNVIDFFDKKFKIRTSQKAKLCTEIAMSHLSDILLAINIPKDKIVADNDLAKIKESNKDFLLFLAENYTTIFEGSTNYFNNKSFPFIDSDGSLTDGSLSVKKYYIYSDDLNEIVNLTWLPQNYIKIISSEYENLFEDSQLYLALIKKLGAVNFDFNTFMADVILANKDEVIKGIKDFESNKAFHGFFKKISDKITPDNIKKICDFPVFLVGETAPVLSLESKNHQIINDNVMSLINGGYLSAGSINGICNEYFDDIDKDKKYWVEILENSDINTQTIVSILTNTQYESVSKTISQSNDDNIGFWRLIFSFNDFKKGNLKDLKKLPILMKTGSNPEIDYSIHVLNEGEDCYISDLYFSEGGAIEYLVNEYAPNSWLLSPAYLQDKSTESVNDWFSFWGKVGLLSSNEDIILRTIIRDLDNNVNEKIPILLFNNKKLIEENMDEKMKKDFERLHLKTKGGMKRLSEIFFIQNSRETPLEEPLSAFILENQISPDYTEEQISFFQSLTDLNLLTIKSQAEWFMPKIGQYLACQETAFDETIDNDTRKDHLQKIESIHYEFIENLAKFRTAYILSLGLTTQDSPIQRIRLRRQSDNCFVKAQTLSLGSLYKPYCDFQSHGIPQINHSTTQEEDKPEILGLDYVSDMYCQIKDIVSLMNSLGVHHKFIRRDSKFLVNHDFCVYFWTNYVLDKDRWKEINEFIDEGVFNNISCIPTAHAVKLPSELYSRDLIEYVKRLSGGEDLIPIDIKKDVQGPDGISYPHPIFKFNFLAKLSVEHCFEFLLNSRNIEKKKSVLRFLLDYKDNNQLEKSDVENYRNTENSALWLNGQNELTHIAKLYAIGKNDDDALYNIYLGSDSLVISNSNIPDSRFEEICSDVLGMTVLHAKDGVFETIPTAPQTDETPRIIPELKQKSLLLATILCDDHNWLELYNQYKTNVDRLKFIKCQSISIEYKNDKRLRGDDVATVHFDSTTSTFYYVNDWQDKFVFDQLLNFLIKEIGIESSQTLMIKRILDTNRRGLGIDEYVEKFCKQYYTDTDFINALADCYPETAKNLHLTQALNLDDDDRFIVSSPEYDLTMRINEDEKTNNPSNDNSVYTGEDDKQDSSSTTNVSSKSSYDEKQETSGEKSTNTQNEYGSNTQTSTSERNSANQSYSNSTNVEDVSDVPEEFDYDAELIIDSGPDPDEGDFVGSVDRDKDYEKVGSIPHRPKTRKFVKQITKEEIDRLRSNGVPLELSSLEPTKEELDILSQCGISPEQIADTNYLAQLRLYNNIKEEWGEEPEESLNDFIHNANDVTQHPLKGGKYVHACSAAKGVMYVSPSVWNKMLDDKWIICVYLDGKGDKFHRIESSEEFLKLVVKDDVVIKITGKEKVEVVKALYSGMLKNVVGTAYTLIRVASRTNMDAVFAHYVGAMAEEDDGNEELDKFIIDDEQN